MSSPSSLHEIGAVVAEAVFASSLDAEDLSLRPALCLALWRFGAAATVAASTCGVVCGGGAGVVAVLSAAGGSGVELMVNVSLKCLSISFID